MLKYLDENGWALLFSVLTPLIIAFVRYLVAPKANVIAMVVAENLFPIVFTSNNQARLLCGRTLVIRNTGRKEATNIEIAHAMSPTVYRLQPATESADSTDVTGHHFIKIKRLPPRSEIVVETLTEKDMPVLVNMTHDGGRIRMVRIIWQQQFPKYVYAFFALIMLLGFCLLVYVIARFLIAGAVSFGWI